MAEEDRPTGDDAAAALDALGLDAFADTALGLELERLRTGEPWCTASVAGLQFYAYGVHDEVLGRRVIPEPGDRLQVMRRPENTADEHACEVWWRDGHQLGHLPRGLAADLAPRLDAGQPMRAYVLDQGDGSRWSLRTLLVGRACEPVHRRQITGAAERAAEDAAREVWGYPVTLCDPYDPPPGVAPWKAPPRRIRVERRSGDEPTMRQRAAADAWEDRRRAARLHREADLAYALNLLAKERPPLPEGAMSTPDESLRNQCFAWWDQVPPWLATKTVIGGYGLRLPQGIRPFATIAYGKGRRYREYDLYAVASAVPKRVAAPEAAARAAEAAVLRRPQVEARREELEEVRTERRRARWRDEHDDSLPW